MQAFTNTVLVEINRNSLRLLSSDLKTFEVSLESSILSDTKILSKDEFFAALKNSIRSLNSKITKIIFLVEEKDLYDRFFVVRNDDDVSESLRVSASNFVGGSLDDLYCTFQKMSPFVYQFVGIRKELVDVFNELSVGLNLKLVGILPISFIFSKFVGTLDPFFFVHKGVDESTLVASEYGGVYFSGTYSTANDINLKTTSLIKELSTFNREKPITNVYYVGDGFKIDDPFVLNKLTVNNDLLSGFPQFERLSIAFSVLSSSYEEVTEAYYNFRNVLTTALAEPNKTSIVKYVAPTLAVISLIVASFIGFNYFTKVSASKSDQSSVIGASDQKSATSDSKPNTGNVVEEPKDATPSAKLLDKSALKLRVENGVGVAGMASKTKTFVESLGYKVSEVGDAKKTGYEQTELSLKKSKSDYFDLLSKDMTTKYQVIKGKDLDESLSYDGLIIVGKK